MRGEGEQASPLDACIIFHTETGNTRAMAEMIAKGMRQADPDHELAVHLWEIREVEAPELETLSQAQVVVFGAPTYFGDLSWQMKKFIDTMLPRKVDLRGKLAAAFASANAPGGGGYEEAILTMLKALLVSGCLVYSGGVKTGRARMHFGAVSQRVPRGVDAERCRTLGENLARKALELHAR